MKSFSKFLRGLALLMVAGSSVAVSEAQTPPVRIMPLGDSLTSGASNVVVPGGYRNRLYTLLTNAGYNVDFVGTKTDANNPTLPDKDHQGNGGSRIEELDANLGGWLNSVEDPDVILLLAGTNDFSQNFNLGSAQTRLANLIANAATKRPFAKIIVSSLPLRTDSSSLEAQQVAFNAAIPGIVSNQVSLGRSVTYVDMHAAWTAADLDDGVHPNQAGYNKMADVWLPGITNVITPLGTLGTPPAITRTGPPTDLNHLTVRFSKPLADTAATVANYSLNGGLSVSAASLDAATKRIITLTTSSQTPGTLYTLAVSNVKDRTPQQNTIAPGSTVAFSTDAQSNGSFELDFTGWSRTGNIEIKNSTPYTPTNGTKLVAFNAGQMPPNAVLTQSFATTPGVSYILTFDFGALGANSQQKLQLNVAGATMLVNQQLTINGPGNSTSKWVPQTFAFLANSTTTQMSFGDASTITNGVDMLLDNVKLTAQVPRTLTVSSAPTIGVPVTVSPNDLNGNGGAPTGFSRQYLGGTTVTLTAPSTNALNVFSKWQRNGVDFTNSTTATVTLDADYTMNAVYTSSNQVLVNGSFETGTFSPWTVSGGTVGSSAKINGVIVGTNGTKIVEFNSGNSPAGGVITQTFNTQVGATYTLAFDQGVLAYNTNQLKFLVSVTGNSTSLLSQTSTVNGVGNGTVKWTAKSFTFVANSTTSTLTFTDTSTAISAADLLLDNVTVTGPPVVPVNNAPVAVNDSYTTNQNTALVVPAAGVLVNDTDSESNPLTAAVVVAPANGSVTLAANGGFTYTPTNGFSGADSFTYRANDGNSNSNIATVSLTVNPVSVAGIVNGSFEQGSPAVLGPVTGWTQNATWPTAGAPAGHVPDGGYPATVPDGVRLLIFNAGGDIFTGSISQVFSTTPGQTYTLQLNAGVFSAGVTGKKQRLAIGITGASPLVTTVDEFTSTTGTATLVPKSYNFVADSATSTLTLADATSGVTPNSARTGSDLLVDKVSIALAAANTPPVAAADSYSTNQNVALTIAAAGVLTNDTDTESDPLTAALVAGPANGTLNLAANGGFTYTPASGFTGADSFTYRANDGNANSNVVTVSLTVNAVSSELLVNGSFEVGSPAALGPVDGWTQSAVFPTTGAPFGHVPDANYPATPADGVRLLVFNGGGNVFGGSVSQQFTTIIGEEYTLTLNAGVFSSGTAGKKQRLQITVNGAATLLSQAETLTSLAGTATLAPFTYTFTADSVQTTLMLADTSGGVSPNTGADLLVDNVSIEGTTTGPVNTAPAAVADTYSATPGVALVVPAGTGVLANDTDAESDALTAILNVGPSNGTLTLNANGGFTYTAANGFNGTDSFTYHANDGELDSNVVTASITVATPVSQLLVNGSFESDYTGWTTTGNQAVQPTSTGYGATNGTKVATFNGANAAPNAVLSQSFATVAGATYTLAFDAGVYSFNTNPQKMKVDVDGTSSLFSQVLTLNGFNNGTSRFFAQSFTFTANSTLTTLTFRDQSATTAGLDMLLDHVRVTGPPGAPNTPPVAVADSYTTNQQTALVIAAPGLLANDTDAESTPLTAAVDTQPAHGTVTVNANGGFTYTPAVGYFGSDSFTYHASDGVANSNIATVNITINQVSIGGLANGSFEAGEASWIMTGNRVVIDSAAPYTSFHGTKLLVMNGGNTTPNAVITQTFTTTPGTEYTLTFNSGILAASIQQRLQVAVTGSSSLVSDLITLVGNNANASVWTARSYPFTANSATTTLTFTDMSTTSNGGDLLLDNVAVTAAGGPANTAPAAVADSYTTPQNTALVVSAAGVLANDTDAESNPLTAALNVGPTSGTLTLNANGSFTYTPNNGFNGTDSFTYHANDGALDSNIVTVSITVSAPGIGTFANGSFEAGSLANYTVSSWTQNATFPTAGAPLGYVPDGAYPVTVPDGTRILVFNGGSNIYTGSVSQQFATIPGNTYALNLNAGVFANGTAGKKQRLLVNVAGTGTLLTAFEDILSTSGTAALGLRNYTFVADSTVTTLTIADGSTAVAPGSLAVGSDLLVDNVTISSVTLSANAPVAFADTYTTVQDTALVVPVAGVLGNDTDADSDPLTAALVANPTHGAVTLAANGSFTYTPTLGYTGSDSFTYRANDGGQNSNLATVSITVTAPVPTGLVNGSFESGLTAWTESGGTQYSVNLNTSYTGTDGTTLVEFNAANSVNGGVISQTFNTVPGTQYNLTFDLGVIAFNTSQQKLQVTVTGSNTLLSQIATINGINGGTVKWEAKAYTFTANSEQTTLTLTDVSTVTSNIDMLLDNVKANPPGGGTPPSATNLVVNPSFETGVFSPWVTAGGAGSAAISSTIIPTNGTKSVEFNGSNTANGGSVAQTITTTPGMSYTLQFDLGVLAFNAFQQSMKVDVDGTGSLLSQTTSINGINNGTTKWEARSFTFTADSQSATLKFTDVSSTGSGIDMLLDYVRVTSNGVPVGNTAPTAVVDSYSTTQNTPLTIAAAGVLANDVDLQSNPITAILVTGPATGTLNLAANGGFTYTPANGFTGTATFTYKANDGLLDSTPVTVSIAVNAVGALVNGSFENGLTAWTKAGGTADSVKANSIITGTNGTTIVEFNSAQSPAGGSLSQTFTTVAGQSYILNFDQGVLAYNTNAVNINVKLIGSSQLVSQNFTVNGIGSGTVKFVTQTVNFTANSASTTLTFTDATVNPNNGLDLLLDYVRLTSANARTLTIDSVVASNVAMTISPSDANGAGNGTTLLSRVYNLGTVVNVTAPATSTTGATFSKWVKDGVDYATTAATSVTISANTNLVAVYSGGTNPPLGNNIVANGSFESLNGVGWANSWANVSSVQAATRIEQPGAASGFPTHGNNILSFNVGGEPNLGVVEQALATVAGTTYTLRLDVGVYGGPTGQAVAQTLNIAAVGSSTVLSKSVTVQGTTSTFVWAPQTFTFTANSASTILRFSDGSSTGNGTDLFVDNVRVQSGTLAPSILTVNTTPAAGKAITVTPVDLAGQGNGTSNFTRAYATGTTVQLVAPHANFVKWLKNGQWYATNQSITVVVDASVTMTAVYTTTPVLGPFVNGSFEQEFTGWTWTGSQQSVKVKDGLPSTDGLIVVEFNSNNSGLDGSIAQTFTTTVGTTYNVAFDIGTKAFNTSQQKLRAQIQGNTALINQVFTINGIGNGDVIYAAKSFTFTANSATTTLTFSDASATGAGLDLLLDNVRVTAAAPGLALTGSSVIKAGPGTAPSVSPSPAPVATPIPTVTASEPSITTEVIEGTKYLVLTVQKPTIPDGAARVVEVSPDLLEWFSGKNHTTVLEDSATILKVRDNTPVGVDSKRFIRLKTTN